MNNISALLQPNASATAKIMPFAFPLVVALASGFVVYLVRCYWQEWRMKRRVQRRKQRSRSRIAVTTRLLPIPQPSPPISGHLEGADQTHAEAA